MNQSIIQISPRFSEKNGDMLVYNEDINSFS